MLSKGDLQTVCGTCVASVLLVLTAAAAAAVSAARDQGLQPRRIGSEPETEAETEADAVLVSVAVPVTAYEAAVF